MKMKICKWGFIVSILTVQFSVGLRVEAQSGPSVKSGADESRRGNEKASNQNNMMGALMFGMAAERTAACMSMDFAACAMAALFAKMGSDSMRQAQEHDNAARSAG